MSKIKDIQGVISKITRPSSKEFPIKQGKNAGKTFTSWSIGIQLDGNEEWYNIKGSSEDGVLKLRGDAALGDEVKIYLEAEDPEEKYWKINSINVLTANPNPTEEVPVEDVVNNAQPQQPNKIQVDMDKKVQELKENEADKYELGMAKNNAAIIFSQLVAKAEDVDQAKNIIREQTEFYDQLTEALFNKGKIIRQKILGY